jgi:hypothetical protein
MFSGFWFISSWLHAYNSSAAVFLQVSDEMFDNLPIEGNSDLLLIQVTYPSWFVGLRLQLRQCFEQFSMNLVPDYNLRLC